MPFGGYRATWSKLLAELLHLLFPTNLSGAAYGGDNARKTVKHSHHTMLIMLANIVSIALNAVTYKMALCGAVII